MVRKERRFCGGKVDHRAHWWMGEELADRWCPGVTSVYLPGDESYPPDYDPFEYQWEIVGMGAVKYTHTGRVAHLVLPNEVSTCGLDEWLWYGTGTQREREKAHELPVCKKCAAKAGDKWLVKVGTW